MLKCALTWFEGVREVAISETKTRVQMTLPIKLMQRIDEVCDKACVSRSAWIEYTLGMAVDSYLRMIESSAARIVAEDGKQE